MPQEQRQEHLPCDSCRHHVLLSESNALSECKALKSAEETMVALNVFAVNGRQESPFLILSNLETLHDAWPLRFRASTIKQCEGKWT